MSSWTIIWESSSVLLQCWSITNDTRSMALLFIHIPSYVVAISVCIPRSSHKLFFYGSGGVELVQQITKLYRTQMKGSNFCNTSAHNLSSLLKHGTKMNDAFIVLKQQHTGDAVHTVLFCTVLSCFEKLLRITSTTKHVLFQVCSLKFIACVAVFMTYAVVH